MKKPKPLQNLRKIAPKEKIAKGIYILPSLFTMGSILFSFSAIVAVVRVEDATPEHFVRVGLFVVVAAFLDTFDGIVARTTNTGTEFGEQLDSLADVISFGVAPSVIMYSWALHELGNNGAWVAFLFLMAGVIRLARFNVVAGSMDKRYFIGLPIPAAAMLLLTTMVLFPTLPLTAPGLTYITALTLLTSFLMVSSVRFRTFKEINWKERVPVRVVFFLLFVVSMMIWHWQLTLFLVGIGYVCSGLFARYLPGTWNWASVSHIDEVVGDVFGLDIDVHPEDHHEEVTDEPDDKDSGQ